MKYEVNEKKFYKIDDIKNVKDYSFELNHLETTFELEKYELEVELTYDSYNDQEINSKITMPIDLTTTMTEQLTAIIKNVDLKHLENEGVELDITLEIEITEFENENKEEIHDSYQAELEVKLQERCDCELDTINETLESVQEEEVLEASSMIISTNTDSDSTELFSNLKVGYDKYRVLNLEENSLDKISAKYNLPLDYLYNLKKTNSKVIVHDKE